MDRDGNPREGNPLRGKKVLLGVTASISAYKACDLVQRLKDEGAEVRVVLSRDAQKLVHPHTFAALTGKRVLLDMWEGLETGAMDHIEAARWADLFLIAPCSAHTLGVLAQGLAPDLLPLLYLAFAGPVFLAPAMNTVMLLSPAVQRNLALLAAKGDAVLPTASGNLACGENGEGKFLNVMEIIRLLKSALALSGLRNLKGTSPGNRKATPSEGVSPFGGASPSGGVSRSEGLFASGAASGGSAAAPGVFTGESPVRSRLAGRKVLLSLGHTRERIDEVRFLSNRSSGKTGLALARALWLAGAEVSLVAGHLEAEEPEYLPVKRVSTSEEFREVLLSRQGEAEILIMAAAIADFVPQVQFEGKLKGSKSLAQLELKPSTDILAALGQAKAPGQILVGFALESEDFLRYGEEKMRSKNCDFLVVNNPLPSGVGFGEDRVPAAILERKEGGGNPTPNVPPPLELMAKDDLAARLVLKLEERF